ncbi:MAG TPA: hypothetical protein VI503_04400 [Gaiellaceae bacterium]|nr:hypothetical protein [Gaiellaceae bacterium]
MRRIGIFVCAFVLAGLALAPAASAEKPARFFLPAADFVLSGSCQFDVFAHVVANNEYGIEFSNGQVLVTGTFKVRLTNLSNDKSLDVNISGPGVFTFGSDGSVAITAWGNWLFWFFPGMLGENAPGALLLTSGLTTEVLDADSNVVSLNLPPRTRDACAMLT